MKKALLVLVTTIVCTLSALGQTPRQLNEFKQVASGNGVYTWQERRNSAKLNGKYHIVKDARTHFLATFNPHCNLSGTIFLIISILDFSIFNLVPHRLYHLVG